MNKTVAVLDYGMSNLLNIQRAIEQFNVQACIVNETKHIFAHDALIIPGVGAFGDGIKEIEHLGLIDAVKQYAALGKPLLGICLGMQLLFESSEEFGYHQGLGLLKGKITKLPKLTINNHPQVVPHVGWSNITITNNSLFENVPHAAEFYFCHSYAAIPSDLVCRIAYYEYGGYEITAAVNNKNIYGFQFHPEKSGKFGLQLLKNFLYQEKII